MFVAKEKESVWSIPRVSGSYDEIAGELKIQGTKYLNNVFHSDVAFKLIEVHEPEIYSMYSYSGELKGLTTAGSENCDYFHDTLNLGKVIITNLDKSSRIISGTFAMDLINIECEGDTLMKITDGRFDFRY